MSTTQHTSFHARHTQSSPSAVGPRSSNPRNRDTVTESLASTNNGIPLTASTINEGSAEGISTVRQSLDRSKRGVPSSIEMLPTRTKGAETSTNPTIHNRPLSGLSLSAPAVLPPPAPSRRFESPQDQDAPKTIADLKQQLHFNYDADLPSESSTLSLPPPPPPRQARAPSPFQEFSLLPAIELRSLVLDEGIPPSAETRRSLAAMCHWSLYDAAREQKEFIRKTEAQRQIYETAFANLEDELAELDVETNSQESQLALFEDDSEESDREEEDVEMGDSDDEGYEQDVSGGDTSDELEVLAVSESESSSGGYSLGYEVDAEETEVLVSEQADADLCEEEGSYDADTNVEHVANSNSILEEDQLAGEHPHSLTVQSRDHAKSLSSEASEASDDEGELCYPYTLEDLESQHQETAEEGTSKDGEDLDFFDVLDGEIFAPAGAEDKLREVFIDSDEEFKQREAAIYQELERTRPLWSIYSNILPPPRNPPSWYPETLPTFDIEDPDLFPSHRFERVKTLASGNGLSSVCVVRSVWPQRWNGVGLRENSLWAMKMYPRDCGSAEKKRRATTLLHTEVNVYMRIAESPKDEKIGFAFLANLEMTMTFPGNTALLMELMRTDLRTYMDDSRLAQSSIPRLMAQLAMGIATLHSIGIIHRDLKPENIFIDYRGNIKIGDFGTSFVTRAFMALQNDVEYDDAVAGTAEYVSPEMQLEGGMHGIEVDYWALGCVFFEMMADDHVSLFPRTRPRELEDWIQEYSKTREGRASFFEHEGFNEEETDLLCGLLRPNPRRRYGIDEILEHEYFLRDDDSSEFRHLEEALSRACREPVFGPDERPRIRITPNPVDDTVFNWANPYGACFADRKRRAARGTRSQWS